MNEKRSIKNVGWSILAQLVSIVTGLVLTRLFMVGYGSAVNGLINSVTQIFAYFVLLEGGIGAASLQALYHPVAEEDAEDISAIMTVTKHFYNRTSFLYLGAILLFAAVYPLLLGGEDQISGWTMAGVILFTGLGNVVNFRYQGTYKILMQAEGKNYVITSIQTIITIIMSLVKAAAIWMGASIVLVIAAGFVVNMLQCLFYYFYIQKYYRWLDFSGPPAHIGQKRFVMVHQVAQLVFQNTDTLILTMFCGLKVVSVYAAYKVVVAALGTLTYSISESFLFILGQEFATDREKYIRHIDLFDALYTMLSFILFATAYVLYLPFIELYTRGVTDVVYVDPWLPLLFVGIEILSGCRRAMQNTISVAGHFRGTARQTVIETILNLTVSLVLVNFWGIYGALLGTIVALLYRSNEIIWYGNRKILGRGPWKSYRHYGMNLLGMLAVGLVRSQLSLHADGYGELLVMGVVTVVAVGLAFLLLNAVCFPWVLRQVRRMRR